MSSVHGLYLGTTFGSFDDTLLLIKDGLFRVGVEVTQIDDQLDCFNLEIAVSTGAKLAVSCARDATIDRVEPLRAGLERNVVTAAASAEEANDSLIVGVIAALRKSLKCFTASELERIVDLNPLVSAVSERYRTAGISLANVNLVFRDHLLLEKLNLVRCLLALGLSPLRCWLLGKEDRSLFAYQVLAEYANLGCHIVNVCHPYELEAAIAGDSTKWRGQNVLVVDDGGDLIVAMSSLAERIGFVMIPVETTSKGIASLRKKNIPVIDLASSKIKYSLSRDIAVSCVVRVRELLQHHRFARENCHVIGYGNLGSHIANLLRELGVHVSVSDPDPTKRAAAAAAGFQTARDVSEALRKQNHRFVFGCSGVPALSAQDLQTLLNPAYLVSASSQDLRQAISYLRGNAEYTTRLGFGDTYCWNGHVIHVIAHGHAVNLYQAEGVSEPEYDSFTALLAVTIVELAKRWRAGAVDMMHIDVNELCENVPAPEL